MRAAISYAAQRHGWRTERAGPWSIYGTYKRGKAVVKIKISYSESSFDIEHVSSRSLHYNASEGEIHVNYSRWIRNLERTIVTELGEDWTDPRFDQEDADLDDEELEW